MKLNNMKDKLINMDKGKIIKNVKRVTIITATSVILLGGVSAYAGYRHIESNEKYTQGDCEKIALKQIPGEIIKTEKDFNDDTLSLTYEFKIKGKDNVLREIEVDSKSGAIIDMDHDDIDYDDVNHDDRVDGNTHIESNEKYTQGDCEKIALKEIPGEIVQTEKEFDEDTQSLTYEFKIKGKDNVLKEIEVDSKNGAIIDIDHVDLNDNDRFDRN